MSSIYNVYDEPPASVVLARSGLTRARTPCNLQPLERGGRPALGAAAKSCVPQEAEARSGCELWMRYPPFFGGVTGQVSTYAPAGAGIANEKPAGPTSGRNRDDRCHGMPEGDSLSNRLSGSRLYPRSQGQSGHPPGGCEAQSQACREGDLPRNRLRPRAGNLVAVTVDLAKQSSTR